ncbi:ATP synthase, subunit D, chloroplast precursor [Dunaliella salina]|uniref:ATP synthase, subunit D, chloroplast n=1 Tax=Dunaliella salina TaxID=3046 RepID=A0ABQ7H3A5_DUNSA|nr:ATP synthase, subunit D, chloroplast precursor [Dunaliella salina]|eukprot:KAF5841353.1 ATP synthase, subunit D, chloroplast precursor [Dunaliella salina]
MALANQISRRGVSSTGKAPIARVPVARAPIASRSRRTAVKVQAVKNPVGESYAKALVDLANEKGKLEPIHADMDAVSQLMNTNKALSELVTNPVIDKEKKRAVLAKIGQEAGFQTYTNNFLNLLVEKDRMHLIYDICEAFEAQYCELTDTQVALLRSAVKLEQEQQFLIAKKIQELSGSKNIKLKPTIDSSVIAGFIVEYGSQQIDMSVRGQVDNVTEELSKQMAMKMA